VLHPAYLLKNLAACSRMGQRDYDVIQNKGLLQGIGEFSLAPPNARHELLPEAGARHERTL
jgi:hypothetical protein